MSGEFRNSFLQERVPRTLPKELCPWRPAARGARIRCQETVPEGPALSRSSPSQPLTLTYYGHCAFLWRTTGGLRVLADPYRNKAERYWFNRLFPTVECDLGLITHAHFDHDAADRLPEGASLLRMPGQFRQQDMSIQGIRDFHSGASGLRGMANVMFLLETEGLRFLHIGDNRADWPEAVSEAVGRVDVLMVTVDDTCHLLSYEEVGALIARVDARIVIPMHYQVPGLMPDSCGLKPPEGWLATQPNVRRLEGHQVALSPGDLPASTEVWVFQPSPDSLSAPEPAP